MAVETGDEGGLAACTLLLLLIVFSAYWFSFVYLFGLTHCTLLTVYTMYAARTQTALIPGYGFYLITIRFSHLIINNTSHLVWVCEWALSLAVVIRKAVHHFQFDCIHTYVSAHHPHVCSFFLFRYIRIACAGRWIWECVHRAYYVEFKLFLFSMFLVYSQPNRWCRLDFECQENCYFWRCYWFYVMHGAEYEVNIGKLVMPTEDDNEWLKCTGEKTTSRTTHRQHETSCRCRHHQSHAEILAACRIIFFFHLLCVIWFLFRWFLSFYLLQR